jgi:UDP-N-acetylmuramoylalanine--D-glutamate ligase
MKRIAVIGGGESGVGAALLAKKQGWDVFVSDGGKIAEKYKEELKNHGIPFEEEGHDTERILVTEVVVKSPGVPEEAPLIRMLREKGKCIISEIEMAHQLFSGLTIAITGSNGKTTTSGLLYHMLKRAGRDVRLGGNYGESYARILSEENPAIMVLEVSSFQLDDIDTFKPWISILLNITPDHLDRYQYQMEKYVGAKFRVAENQTAGDHFIFNGDDPEITAHLSRVPAGVHLVSVNKAMYGEGIPDANGQWFELTIQGLHNLFNAACCVEACRLAGLTEEEIREGLRTFVNLPHRLESCGFIGGIEFINDSKATNVDSVYYALEAQTRPVVWIAGGTDKGNDYELLLPLVQEKVKALICLGADNAKIISFFSSYIPVIIETTKVSSAVENGLKLAEAGDVVLLSPACASFDLFKNYIDRGDQFKRAVEAVRQLESEHHI